MKKIVILWALFTIVGGLFAVYGVIWDRYIYPTEYEADLKLADDASLPYQKAYYLEAYLRNVKTITGSPRYIFMRPDLELDRQIDILEGLIKRFNDISQIAPSEMAYQQGMQQLTGQEMNHQLDRVSDIFKSARMRQNFLLYLACGGFGITLVITILIGWVFILCLWLNN